MPGRKQPLDDATSTRATTPEPHPDDRVADRPGLRSQEPYPSNGGVMVIILDEIDKLVKKAAMRILQPHSDQLRLKFAKVSIIDINVSGSPDF